MYELWSELGTSMRVLRTNAGLSLRQVEAASGRGRGVLSQVENGKARPNRQLVEWYDDRLGGDGLLMSLYVEARTGHGSAARAVRAGPDAATARPEDALDIVCSALPTGSLVRPGHCLELGWTLANTGNVTWTGRSLRRVGACAGARVLGSDSRTPLTGCPPGGLVDAWVTVRAPQIEGTYVGYWQMVDADQAVCPPGPSYLSALLVVRS